jgi:hypothetical protein
MMLGLFFVGKSLIFSLGFPEFEQLNLQLQVYNVTQYMRFHPGGVEELMKGVGNDGTSLFGKNFL